VWVHRGEALEECTAMKLNQNMMSLLFKVIKKLGKNRDVNVERKKDGEVTIFGESRANQQN